ncbi:hypothetical protein NADE_001842 [Nannochloris sp. 'desiccata']|nr:hypothetical protein KSW81_001310 [Chlorella desiccata (nom. nud.)]KAH7617040.1 hypothetical protein NADE_001842 [Chlorella desiccata (nom. nud.)]
MACLTACRKARAWQRQVRAICSINSLCYDITLPAVSWLQAQRFYSTDTSPLATAAVSAADVHSAASAPSSKRSRPKRVKLDENELLEAAKRIFDMSLGTEKDLIDGEVEGDGAGNSSDSSQPVISSELIEEHHDMLAAMDKRRERNPLMAGETLESWFTKHRQDLQPFLTFLHRHGADQTRTVAELYTAGYWGRTVMLPPTHNGKDDTSTKKAPIGLKNEDSDVNNNAQPQLFEKLFSEWADALEKEDVHLTAADLLQRWPRMLTRQPFKLGTTLAVLRAALPEDGSADVQDLIEKAPRILGIAPLEMQKRLLKLHLATEGEIQRMLVYNPLLLTHSLDNIFSNLRLVREHSRSAREFKSFLYTSPLAIGRPPRILQKSASIVRASLEKVLPHGVDAVEVIKAKPQLLLVKSAWLVQRWESIEDAVQLMDEWKEEFRNLVKDCADMPSSTNDSTTSFSSTLSSLFERMGDGTDDIPSPSPPEWIHKDMDPHSLGVHSEKSRPKMKEIWELDEDTREESADNHDTVENEEGATIEAVRKGRKAYSALGEALWMRPWRIQRLEYMAEQAPEEAARVSFVSAMAVTLEQFEERFPEFYDWVKGKQEESDYYQQREGKKHYGLF